MLRPQFARQLPPRLPGILLKFLGQDAGIRRPARGPGALSRLAVRDRLAIVRPLLAPLILPHLLGGLLKRVGRLLHRLLGRLRLTLPKLVLSLIHLALCLLQRLPSLGGGAIHRLSIRRGAALAGLAVLRGLSRLLAGAVECIGCLLTRLRGGAALRLLRLLHRLTGPLRGLRRPVGGLLGIRVLGLVG